MRQAEFEARAQARWHRFAEWLAQPARHDPLQFVDDYRAICRDLSLANSRGYSASLQQRLNAMAQAGHNRLYVRRSNFAFQLVRFVAVDFPRIVRAEWRIVLVATLALFGPGLIVWAAIMNDANLVYSVLPAGQVAEMESMYDPAARISGDGRGADSDVVMFGFYINNNIGIGFRCFAGGVLFTLGSFFFLIYNGVVLGAVAAHIYTVGYGVTFFPFVVGHGALELPAICLCGAAGIRLGLALLRPGPYRRLSALRVAGKRALPIVAGGALMLLLAAVIEAFWSPRQFDSVQVKYVVGGVLWAAMFAYFAFAGRTPRTFDGGNKAVAHDV